MKKCKKFLVAMCAIAMLACSFVMPAGAANVKLADPNTLIAVAAEKAGVEANLDALLKAHVITSAEKTLITKNNVITRAVAYRVLLPVFGIYPYPASLYPEISPADQCVNDYANARCAAITIGLTTEKENPIQVMSASELETLVSTLRQGVTLPRIETGIPYVDSVETWDRNSYEGRNSMIEAYAQIPAAWLTDFEAQGWTFKYELPVPSKNSIVIENHSVAGSTNYQEKVVRVGRSQGKVTLHEMVHYIVKRANISKDQMNVVFDAEKAVMKDILGPYSQTVGSEYVPEFVAYWLANPTQHDTLKATAPLSSQMAETMVNWAA